jgi:ceramide glucosyltransferase
LSGFRTLPVALDTTEISKTPAAVWARHRRWAIIRRRVGGAAYAAELVASPLPWFTGVLAFSGGRASLVALAGALVFVRYLTEVITERDGGHRFQTKDLPLLPLRDLIVAVLFWAGLLGRTTSWRGRKVFIGPRTLIGPELWEPRGLLRPASYPR